MTSPLCVRFISEGGAEVPARMREGDAGIDLRSTEDVLLKPFQRALIPTGLRVAIPGGYAGYVLPRSGLAVKHGFSLVNSPGLIDSNYRGEIKVIGINLDPSEDFLIKAGDRIAQLVVLKTEEAVFLESDRLDDTERGESGFGSSGVS